MCLVADLRIWGPLTLVDRQEEVWFLAGLPVSGNRLWDNGALTILVQRKGEVWYLLAGLGSRLLAKGPMTPLVDRKGDAWYLQGFA